MLEFDMIQSCFVLLFLLVVGEFLSKYMKVGLPAVFLSGLIFIGGVWSGLLPANLVESSGLAALVSFAIMMIIANMGASMSARELLDNWRVVLFTAVVFLGQVALLFLVIGSLFGVNMAVGALPGGSMTALIVQERARSLGYDQIVVLSVLIFSCQGMVACPLVSLLLKKEVARGEAAGLSTLPVKPSIPRPAKAGKSPSGLSAALRRYKDRPAGEESQYWALFRLCVAAWLASRLEMLTGVSRYALCLLTGILLGELGFLRKDEMDRTKSQGFFFLMMMAMILNGFAAATPEMFAQMVGMLACVLLCEIGSILLLSSLLGRFFGFSQTFSMALGMNVMVGFPVNMMLSEEVIHRLVKDEEERTRLMTQVGMKMVISGFTSLTFLATVAASILVNLMK